MRANVVGWVLGLGLSAAPTLGANQGSAAVVIYGGTPAGIAAALAAARGGREVLLLESTTRVGGMISNGLTHPDFRTFESLTGSFLAFTRAVQEHYRAEYGRDSPEATATLRGTHAEPRVWQRLFEEALRREPRLQVRTQAELTAVEREGLRLRAIRLDTPDGPAVVKGAVFIDATYEGDLLALAGARWRVGREGRDETGESLAPPAGDGQLQGYNFRLTMTDDPALRVPVPRPDGYRAEDFQPVNALLESGRLKRVFGQSQAIYKAQVPPLPRRKRDINDVSRSALRLSLPGHNLGWPTGDAATRAAIFRDHLRWNIGLLFFLQNDPSVSARVREEATTWGLCRDEFVERWHLPEQLYVREARRLRGRYVFRQQDVEHAPGDARAVFHPDSVAMGDYGPNCHGSGREGTLFDGQHVGEFYHPSPPYQIPFGVLLPEAGTVENLLVPVACSSTHVGFCALRLEPIWMSLGDAAGHAAVLAPDGRVAEVNVRALQRRLHEAGSATLYVSDVLPGHPHFALVQELGARGGLHGLHPAPEQPGQRGKHIIGQYFEAFPGHALEWDRPLDADLHARWSALMPGGADWQPGLTRGAWLESVAAAQAPFKVSSAKQDE
jgi:hypothetical protein